jgi:tetratricopeptide (TPR) repeat protein
MNRFMRAGTGLLLVAIFGLSLYGFQCSSPNVTGGKLYLQQYEQSKDVKKLEMAIESFQKEINTNPANAEAWYWMGLTYGLKKDYLKLQESWAKSLQAGQSMKNDIDSRSPGVVREAIYQGQTTLQKAQIKKDKSLYQDAANYFKAANLLIPDTSAKYYGFYNYALTQLNLGNNSEAMAAFQQQLKSFPIPGAYKLMGDLTINEGLELKKAGDEAKAKDKFNSAITLLEQGTTKFPENSDLNQSYLNALVLSGRAQEAAPKIKAFADGNPKDKMSQYAYGTLCLETKDFEPATQYLEKAIQIDGKFENAIYNVAIAYLKWGLKIQTDNQGKEEGRQSNEHKALFQKATDHAKKLIEMKPDDTMYLELMAKLYTAVGNAAEAQKCYEKLDALKSKQK